MQDPAPGKAAPPFSLSASAPGIFPSLWRRWTGCSATLQRQQLLLPSLGGCPGRHSRQRPPLRSLLLAREDPTHSTIGRGAGVCSAPLPARPPSPRPGTSRFWPTRYRGRGSPRRRRRRRAKAAPGRMLLPDSPYAERLQRAGASLCAAAASLRRVGARGRPSLRLLPFAALPSSSAGRVPAPLAESGSSRRRRRRLGDRRCGARFTATTLGPPSTRPRP